MNTDLILEALRDYRRWFDGNEESDRERREQIDAAIEDVKALPSGEVSS